MDSADRWAEQRLALVKIMLQQVIDPVDCAHCYGQLNCYSQPFGGKKVAKEITVTVNCLAAYKTVLHIDTQTRFQIWTASRWAEVCAIGSIVQPVCSKSSNGT